MNEQNICDSCGKPNPSRHWDGFYLCGECYEISQDNLAGDWLKFKEALNNLFSPLLSPLQNRLKILLCGDYYCCMCGSSMTYTEPGADTCDECAAEMAKYAPAKEHNEKS